MYTLKYEPPADSPEHSRWLSWHARQGLHLSERVDHAASFSNSHEAFDSFDRMRVNLRHPDCIKLVQVCSIDDFRVMLAKASVGEREVGPGVFEIPMSIAFFDRECLGFYTEAINGTFEKLWVWLASSHQHHRILEN